MADETSYHVPDVEPDERTGLHTWKVFVDDAEAGAVIERTDGYQGAVAGTEARVYSGVLPYRQLAIDWVVVKATTMRVTIEPTDSARYIEQVEMILEGFKFELCHECHKDIDRHAISPDPLGNAHAWCLDQAPEDKIG